MRAVSKGRNKGKVAHDDTTLGNTAQHSKDEASTVSRGGNNVNVVPTSTASEHKGSTTLYGRVYSLAKRGRGYLVTQLGLILPSIILLLLGFKELPRSVPLLNIIEQHPVGSPIIGGILLLVAMIALIISFGPEPKNSGNTPKRSKDWRSWRWMIATAMSTTSFIISSTLLAIVLIRPPWCPSSLCPLPQFVVATNPQGIHDDNLDMYFTTLQSTSFVLPDDSLHHPLNKLPESKNPGSIGAVRIDKGKPSSVYRVVLGVHSLLQNPRNILIENVALVIASLPPIPHPLNIWNSGSRIDYHTNPYLVSYRGLTGQRILVASYVSVQPVHVELSPGEPDQLDMQVSSRVPVDLRFRCQVTYHVAGESRLHILVLPMIFEVVFSDSSNWHEYQLRNGTFVAKS
jgi:hypothetical protein